MDNLIFLIGFRAVGKTTVGQELAVRLGYDFLDTDQIICQRKGSSIETIVREEGWEGFRALESQILTELAGYSYYVVATGGGAVMHRGPWRILRQNSLVVWLTASPDVLISRLNQDEGSGDSRPSLTGRDVASEIHDILAEREPLYQKTAHLTIATEGLNVTDIVDIIQKACVRRMGRESK